ncbi:glycosyltransferase [Trebonia kvetii]|uniref:Glycosyltransferase n=1 Tax=Trebonia kvetii TaxID=2480626 RepID=A0A6P2C7B2_9ACTN|nr:glycosyltransferase [Trebonia kvetii]TVZ07110.1 glycosyltransferase [Trebonia kvetii]
MEAPILIGQLELTAPITDIQLPPREDGQVYTAVQLLVRMEHIPVGHVLLTIHDLRASAVSHQIWQTLGSVINERRGRVGLPALLEIPRDGIPVEKQLGGEVVSRPLVSVVVCTRDRPGSLMKTLKDLASLNYSSFEVVVVDNAPSSDATQNAVLDRFGADSRFRYVCEPRPGLSRARNRGILEAAGDYVAFTDDDVRVDQWWLDGIMRGFQTSANVECVTGMIATAEINNMVQLYFHIRAGWGTNCERRLFDLFEHSDASPLYPYTVGRFGAGANFAVTRAVVKEIGGFDEALGAGAPSGGGEDLNMFMRVILGGYCLVYEPSAVVWHEHRADLPALSKQMRAYGTGLTAALTAIMIQSARARRELPTRVLKGVAHMAKLQGGVRTNQNLPPGLVGREIIGYLMGPLLYMKGWGNLRRLRKSLTVID